MSDAPSHGAEFDRDRVYPVLPLRDIVVFPGMIVPLFVGREKSVKALEEVMRDDKHILVVTQKNAQDDDPKPGDIFATGTIASVLQLLKLPDGTVKVLVEGLHRAAIDQYLQTEEYFEAQATALPEPEGDAVEIEALARSAQTELSKDARTKADAELKKLKTMSPMSAEATVVRNYLDWLLSLPWGKKSKIKRDLN